MTKHRISLKSPEESQLLKRKKVVAALAEANIDTSDDEEAAEVDAMNISICEMLDEHKDTPPQSTCAASIRSFGETLRNTLLEINVIRERNRERRHTQLLDILNKLVRNDAPVQNKPTYDQDENKKQEQESADKYLIEPANAESLHIKILETPTTSDQIPSPLELENPVLNLDLKKTDLKAELELMRKEMLEMQRKKMEKRLERKKVGTHSHALN